MEDKLRQVLSTQGGVWNEAGKIEEFISGLLLKE